MVSHEQRLFQNLKDCILMNISIGIMDKYTRLCVTICIDMEVVSSSCDTSAYKFTVILEIHSENSRTMLHITDLSYTVLHINSLFRIQKQINRSRISNRHIVEIESITTALFYKHIDKFFAGNTLVVCTCIADRSTKHKTMLFQQIHRMHNLAIDTFSTAKVINFRFSFYAQCKIQVSDLLHLFAECFIDKGTIGICKEYTVIMFPAKFNDIFFSYHRFSTGHHIEINTEFFTLCHDRIHIVKRKIQFIAVFCCPASCTVKITCTGWIHQNDPRNITVMDFSHLTDCFGSIIEGFKSKIHKCGFEHIRVKFFYHGSYITV